MRDEINGDFEYLGKKYKLEGEAFGK
jgi:hypothetical protein